MPTLTDNPVKDGYNFLGWYDNIDYTQGTQYYNSEGIATKKFDKTTNLVLYAAWSDNVLPTCTMTSTNNVATSQTASLLCTDEGSKVKSYYWGTSSNPADADFTTLGTATANLSTTKTVSNEGTYYLIAKDSDGNTSTAINETFYKTIFSFNNVSITPPSVITKNGNSFNLPTPVAPQYELDGSWYTNEEMTEGAKAYGSSYTPSSNTTLYTGGTVLSYSVQLQVTNGTGSTTKNVEYNETTTFQIGANSGYENPTIECTNDQTATISGTTVTTGQITNNTTCTVTYQRS